MSSYLGKKLILLWQNNPELSLRLVVGDKVRIGKVKEKKQARKDFNRAKSEKKSTALVE